MFISVDQNEFSNTLVLNYIDYLDKQSDIIYSRFLRNKFNLLTYITSV